MKAFRFDEWTFEYADENDNGKLGSSTKHMADYIAESDIFWVSGCNKPIITRAGITKLMSRFDLLDHDIKVSLTAHETHGVFVSAVVAMKDKNGHIFIGDGEASDRNTEGLAQQYIQAMAVKRARSRGVLNYLHIDAYGEDEAQSFADAKPVTIDSLPPSEIDKAQELFSKKTWLDAIKQEAGTMSKEELKNFIVVQLGLEPSSKITLSSLSSTNLQDVYNAILIANVCGAEGLRAIEERNKK